MGKTRLLFVDDEPSIRTTLAAILQMHDFDVTTASDVSSALSKIQSQQFDVLLSDLNIGEAGDGFTIVSAMRRIQPEAITIIITGYPAFETALQAIRNQVDDYVVKPAETEELIRRIRVKLADHSHHHLPPPLKKLSFILEDNLDDIMKRYVGEMRESGKFPLGDLSDEEVLDSIGEMLVEVIAVLRSEPTSSDLSRVATEHGITRARQNFTALMMLDEMRLLRNIIYSVTQENLLTVDVSTLIPDMIRIANTLDARLTQSTRAHLTYSSEIRKTA
jgi:YesN/AraC family two-component response regulator